MNTQNIKPGLPVKVVKLEDTTGMSVSPRHLWVRQEGMTGTVKGHVPGHGGDVWWVQHDGNDDIGAYCFTELEAL